MLKSAHVHRRGQDWAWYKKEGGYDQAVSDFTAFYPTGVVKVYLFYFITVNNTCPLDTEKCLKQVGTPVYKTLSRSVNRHDQFIYKVLYFYSRITGIFLIIDSHVWLILDNRIFMF